MFETFFSVLRELDTVFWGYIAFALIIILGFFLTFKYKFFQIRDLPKITKTFFLLIKQSEECQRGVHPLKAFFASVGGMIGIGNICGVVTAVQLGGPGALFWLWVAGAIGAVVKYSEIYLGLKYRVANAHGGYDGGPMYFLRAAFKNRFLPVAVAFLLCIYGVDIYQFSVVTESIVHNWHVDRHFVIVGLLAMVLVSSLGGVNRIGKVCSFLMPFFLITYLGLGCWILLCERSILPSILGNVFTTAFTGHAAYGGFVGSTVVMAIQQGISRAAYSADLGIGYDSIIQSESSTLHPERQARLAILGVFLDNVICTFSILVVLVTGLWQAQPALESSEMVQQALSAYFPHMDLFMPLLISIFGFTTIIAYFTVGIKCAKYLHERLGPRIYLVYGIVALVFTNFFDEKNALLIMSLAGASLLIINLLGIFRLRKEIIIAPEPEKSPSPL